MDDAAPSGKDISPDASASESSASDKAVDATPVPEPGFFEGFGAAAGLFANPIVSLSLYNVASTGGGLDPGPYGLLGALEGISFLVVFGIVAAALVSKVSRGSGLPAGPLGLLGLSEGLSFLSVFGLLVFPLKELGVVGNPETAIVNVPAVAASVSAAVGPLAASVSEVLSGALSGAFSEVKLPEGLPSMPGAGAEGMPPMPKIDLSAAKSFISSAKMPDLKLPEGVPSLPEGLSLPDIKMPNIKLPEGMPPSARDQAA